MIKKLRKKFITVTMCSVISVLTVIITVINIASFVRINRDADFRISQISLSGSTGALQTPDGNHTDKDKKHPHTLDMPFEIKCFTVTLDMQGNVISVFTDRFSENSEDTAATYAKTLFQRNKEQGFIDGYKYRAVDNNGEVEYIFLDCSRELDAFVSFFITSITVSITGILLVFLLVLFLSNIVIKPFIENYEKQKRFITDAGHEIKTPLTIIDAGADVLEMENGANEWTKSIKNQVKRLTELTEKLVFLSRMEEDEKKLITTEFSLSELANEVLESFEAVAATKEKSLTSSIQDNIIYRGDKEAINRLFSILLDNAMKYSDKNGTINLTLSTSGKNKEIRVYNTVDFIEKGKHDEFFERFYRADASRNSKTGGHGIGLSSAKAIVTAHKGRISAYSADNKSIVFTVIL